MQKSRRIHREPAYFGISRIAYSSESHLPHTGDNTITATFVGYWLYGLAGSVIATVSVFLPSFMLVVGLVPYFDRLRASRLFNRIIGGILCSFVGLLLTVTLRFAGNVQWDVLRLILAGAAFMALRLKVDILWVVAIGATVSVLALR